MNDHGVYVHHNATASATPNTADIGVPFVVGTAPVHAADAPAKVGVPVVVTDWADAVKKFGYSDDWTTYTLCEAMYAHLKLYGASPAIFVNVLDPAKATEDLGEQSYNVTANRAELPFGTVNDSNLKVTVEEETKLTKGDDFNIIYDCEAGKCWLELTTSGQGNGKASVTVTGKKIKSAPVEKAEIITGLDAVGKCVNTVGVIPDFILAPGYSHEKDVAAVMATKAEAISGHFEAYALCDLDTGTAKTSAQVSKTKTDAAMTDAREIVCWPLVTYQGKKFHLSVQMAGLMAALDRENGTPHESPSNLSMMIDGACLSDGTEVNLEVEEANQVQDAGVVTVLNFVNGWTSWGNYTACWPETKDPRYAYIGVGRMMDFIGNTVQRTTWDRCDRPMRRVLVDAILNSVNTWLSGLVGNSLLGARVEALESENPPEELEAGHIKYHIYAASPLPTMKIDFFIEFDRAYVTAAFEA